MCVLGPFRLGENHENMLVLAVFRCFERFLGTCYQGYICMICCPMGSQHIPEVIPCFIVVKSMKMCVLGPFRSWWKSWKITGFGCFSLFWAVLEHMLPGTYMYDMLSYGFPTYPRGHILLHCCKIDENVCFRSISDLVKIMKTHWFWQFFAVLRGFWAYVTRDIYVWYAVLWVPNLSPRSYLASLL